MKRYLKITASLLSLLFLYTTGACGSDKNIENYLKTMAEEFINEIPPDSSLIFGIKLKGDSKEEWTIRISSGKAEVNSGLPKQSSFCFVTDRETFIKIATKELNPLTAMARANINDPAPLDVIPLNGFMPNKKFLGKLLPMTYSFFITKAPEVVYFGEKFSREIHGGKAVVFYYTPGLRSAWYRIEEGMMINKDFNKSPNPFPSYFIVTDGSGKARIGKKEIDLRKGMGLLVPAGVPHQFWVEKGNMELIVIMFGEGA